ncbi:MAG: glycerate kinase, partial [Actinobacteria bacterium]|nr:glycerate kinase [Actinomycetota bacterium]
MIRARFMDPMVIRGMGAATRGVAADPGAPGGNPSGGVRLDPVAIQAHVPGTYLLGPLAIGGVRGSRQRSSHAPKEQTVTMRIVIAPDSFKESLSAREACEAIAAGVHRAVPAADCVLVPMADGGEGTADVVREALGAIWVEAPAVDPLGRPLIGRYAWLESRALAVIEMAETSGVALLRPEERDPLRTTSRGFGMLISDALERGAGELILTIGGSATNDAGAGALQALGAVLRDTDGTDIGPGVSGLRELARLDLAPALTAVTGVSLRTACDVTNPLLGPRGASAVYGPQKGL